MSRAHFTEANINFIKNILAFAYSIKTITMELTCISLSDISNRCFAVVAVVAVRSFGICESFVIFVYAAFFVSARFVMFIVAGWDFSNAYRIPSILCSKSMDTFVSFSCCWSGYLILSSVPGSGSRKCICPTRIQSHYRCMCAHSFFYRIVVNYSLL